MKSLRRVTRTVRDMNNDVDYLTMKLTVFLFYALIFSIAMILLHHIWMVIWNG